MFKGIKSKSAVRGAFIFVLLLFLLPMTSAGEEGKGEHPGGKVVTLPPDQVINGDYFASGDLVEILGVVHGDVYAAGREVRIGGTVDGDLLAAGKEVRVSGEVMQDARIAGGEVTVAGEIGQNLTVAGGKIFLAETAAVDGNVTSAGDLTVASRVKGNLHAMGGNIRLTSNAVVMGKVGYLSRRAASIEEGARIGGGVTQRPPPRVFDFSTGAISGFLIGMFLFMKVIHFFSTLILGFLFVALFPRFSREVVSTLKRKPLASLGWGFVLMIATPVLLVALLVTIIGIPLAVILLPLYLIGLYLARIVFMLWVGMTLLNRFGVKEHEGWALLVGLLIYTVLTVLPGSGGLITFFVITLGLGAVLLTAKQHHAPA
jgi:cytoskeletal protein CcmA (bactofilin family)